MQHGVRARSDLPVSQSTARCSGSRRKSHGRFEHPAQSRQIAHIDIWTYRGDVQRVNAVFVVPPLTPTQSTDPSVLGLLRILEASPSRTQREVAQELRTSLGKTNYLLRTLFSKGFVKIHNFKTSSNKRGYSYFLTREGFAAKSELTKQFLACKIAEYDALRLEIERLRKESGDFEG